MISAVANGFLDLGSRAVRLLCVHSSLRAESKSMFADDLGYRRTALILMYEDDIDDIRYAAEGISFGFEKLKKSTADSPTAEDRVWVTRILEHRQGLKLEEIMTLMRYFLSWKDLGLWKRLLKLSACSLNVVPFDLLRKAWKYFHSRLCALGEHGDKFTMTIPDQLY